MLNTLEAIPLPRDGGSQQATLTARVDPILTAKRGGEPIFSSMERGGRWRPWSGSLRLEDAVGEVHPVGSAVIFLFFERPKTTCSIRHMSSLTPVSIGLRRPVVLPSRMKF